MEITSLSQAAIKVRGKHISLLIDPFGIKGKQAVDVILLLRRSSEDQLKNAENTKLIIGGAGEYEVGGVNINGYRIGEDNLYTVMLDGMDILIAKSSSLTKAKDFLSDYHIVLLHTVSIADQSLLTSLNAHAVLLYGDKKEENAKAIGAGDTTSAAKFVVTREKLPAEMQVILLG